MKIVILPPETLSQFWTAYLINPSDESASDYTVSNGITAKIAYNTCIEKIMERYGKLPWE